METLRDTPEVLYGGALALLLVLVLTPAIASLARRIGAVDQPEPRRLNDVAVPRLGGIALFIGIVVPSLGFLPVGDEARGLLLGAAVATLVGLVDDFRGLAWWQKLGGQVTAAAVPITFGVSIDRFTFPLVTDPYLELPAWVGVGATIVWVVAIMNMVNFLDGMDGLAAGVCAIAGTTFAIISLSLGKPTPAIFSAVVAGACFGFLRHNFFPARIFMGDAGALLLGYALATVAIQGLLKTASTVALFFPLFVLAIPTIDTGFVLARRLKHGEKLYVADQAHLHFRFLRRGFSQQRAALTMYGWCVALAAGALATRFVPFREGGDWHLGPTLLAGAIGLVAFAYSIYVVYILELVKLAGPRARRRLEQPEREVA